MIVTPILVDFVAAYAAQPATAFWRGIEIAATLSTRLPTGRGLDLGCGDGILTAILLRHAGPRDLVGVDLDPLETAAAVRLQLYRQVHTCPSNRIPEPDASFDFVISNSVLEHIQDLEGTVRESSRLLGKGGVFMATVPGPGFHRNVGGGRQDAKRAQYLADLDRRLAHVRYLADADWGALLERHGLQLEACLHYLSPAETRRWERLSAMTGGLLYRLGGRKAPPIEIQRRLGARSVQNRVRLPRSLARVLARGMAAGLPSRDAVALPLVDDPGGSCQLLLARKLS